MGPGRPRRAAHAGANAMDRAEVPYRLVVFDALDDPPAVRDLFARVTGAHPVDAMQWVARVPGVWPKLLDESQARQLLDGLYDLKVAAEAWRVDAFPDIARPRTIHEASCLAGGFRVTGLRGEPTHWVPWDRIELICAGRIDAEDEVREVHPPGWIHAISTGFRAATGRSPRTPRRLRSSRTPRDPVGEVIVVRRDPRVAFRIVENQMNYGYLGDRLRPSAAENFPKLLADLQLLATSAYLTPSTLALLNGDDPEDPDGEPFPSSQSLVDHATIQLLWHWYRRDREANRGTEEHDALGDP